MYKQLVGAIMRGFTENTSTQTRYIAERCRQPTAVCHAEKAATSGRAFTLAPCKM